MNSIRQQDFAVLIISKAYLESEGCLYEVVQLMKDEHWDERVMYVVTDDAHDIYNTTKQLDFIEYWDEKYKDFSEKLKKYDLSLITEQAKELNKYNEISHNIGTFLAKVKKTNNPVMEGAIDAVVRRVTGDLDVAPDTTIISATDEFEDKINHDEITEYLDIPETLRKGWNFHGDIAVPLEFIARRAFGYSDRPYTKICDADAIECGKFVEVMIAILRERTNMENGREDIDEFIRFSSRFIDDDDIDDRIAQALYERFLYVDWGIDGIYQSRFL